MFFSTHRSLGQRTIKLQRQSDEPGPYAAYSENARWRKGPVVYVTLNVQGSNDNYAHLDVAEDVGAPPYTRSAAEIARQDAEHFARLAADKQWLSDTFAYAKSVHALGVMVIWQADPNFNNEQHIAAERIRRPRRHHARRSAGRRWRSRVRSCSSTETATTSRSTSP